MNVPSPAIAIMETRAALYPVAIELVGPSGKKMTVGKVFGTAQYGWVFYFEVKDTGALRKLDSVAVAPEVLDWLEARGIAAIHVYDVPSQKLFITDVATFRRQGVRTKYYEGVRLQLPRIYCKQATRGYKVPWIDLTVQVKAGV